VPIKNFEKHCWNHRNKLLRHNDVVYLVSPNGDAENARNENTRHENAAPYCVT